MKVSNMQSNNSYNAVANQFLIETNEGEYFQSYQSIIAFRDNNGNVTLDEHFWDYSRTTGKYRNQFLGEGKKETQEKINSGIYKLANLNVK